MFSGSKCFKEVLLIILRRLLKLFSMSKDENGIVFVLTDELCEFYPNIDNFRVPPKA